MPKTANTKSPNTVTEEFDTRAWLASLEKGAMVHVKIYSGNIQWSSVEKEENVTLTRAGRKYLEIADFDGTISRETGRGKDSNGRNITISPV